VQGNIYNINDETEVVLGYFDAASVEEKRVFISRGDLPPTSLPNVYNWCEDSTVSYNQIEEMMHYGYSLYTETVDQFGSTVYVMANSKYCVDCTLRGSNIRPDFWE
jgi:cytochrome c